MRDSHPKAPNVCSFARDNTSASFLSDLGASSLAYSTFVTSYIP